MKIQKCLSAALILVSALGSLGASAVAYADDEILLGRTILLSGPPGKRADIPVIGCRRVDAIKIQAVRELRLNRVELKYQNGEKRMIQFQRELGVRESTIWRPLAYTRCITYIKVFGYSKNTTSGIKVYGRQK